MRDLITTELQERSILHEVDAAGNVVVRFAGTGASTRTTVLAGHMDEVGMTVKRIDDGGRLRLAPLGGVVPQKYGEGPVDVLGEHATCPGVLSYGSVHASGDSGEGFADPLHGSAHATQWKNWCVHTTLSTEQLAAAGVHPGVPVVPSRGRREPVALGENHLSGYALDDKASVPILLDLAERLRETPPPGPVVLGFTVREEVGCHGAAWLAREQLPDVMIAVEVAPIMPEYGLTSDTLPTLWLQDAQGVVDGQLAAELRAAGDRRGVRLQGTVSEIGCNDATWAVRTGHAARYAAIAAPISNTHGWEILNTVILERMIDVLDEFVHAVVT